MILACVLRQGASAICNGLGERLDPVPVPPAVAGGLQWLTQPLCMAFLPHCFRLPQLPARCCFWTANSEMAGAWGLLCHPAAHHPDMHCYLHVFTA